MNSDDLYNAFDKIDDTFAAQSEAARSGSDPGAGDNAAKQSGNRRSSQRSRVFPVLSLFLLLAIGLAVGLLISAKSKKNPAAPVSTVLPGDRPSVGNEIRLIRYHWAGYGVSTKTIQAGELADQIIEALKAATETGEKEPWISDAAVNESYGYLPVERGTMWIEVDDMIYRLKPDLSGICRVDSHLGGGKVLTMSEQLRYLINAAWYCYPNDYYTGTYKNATGELTLEHFYTAETSVAVSVGQLEVSKKWDQYSAVTLELLSSVDQTATVTLNCFQSDDNLGAGDHKELTLTAGEAQTVKLSFKGWPNYAYWISITVDNTRIEIKIEP